jgi:hypothetical protein
VRTDVDSLAPTQSCRSHLIEEDEGSNHRPLLARQGTMDLEAAEVVSDWLDGLENRIH